MALIIGKTTKMAFNTTSNCVKTSLRTIISATNKSLIVKKPCSPRSFNSSCNSILNNANLQNVFRTLSTTSSLKSDMYFTKKHEWVTVVGNMGTVGITDYAQQSLGNYYQTYCPLIHPSGNPVKNISLSQGNNCEMENNWEGSATSFDRADFQVESLP